MPKVIKLKKGLDISLVGEALSELNELPLQREYALVPDNFRGVVPKMLVKEGEEVKAGTPLFFDKYHPEVLFCSPVSGTLAGVVRGAKRKILKVVVQAAQEQRYETFDLPVLEQANKEVVSAALLKAGFWPMVLQRPYGIIADALTTPKAIFVSGFDSAPLAPDMDYLLAGRQDDLQMGFRVLAKLTDGKVHLGLRSGREGVLDKIEGVEKHYFSGPHPAGNVGVQIHHIDPINKGELVWTVGVQEVAMIGRFFRTGRPDYSKVIALTGSEVAHPQYLRVISGASIGGIIPAEKLRPRDDGAKLRYISGNVLTGAGVEPDGFLGYYSNQVTVIPEGDRYEFLGWGMPRLGKFSVSHSYFSWLMPRKKYVLDANMNGGERAFVVTGLYDKYLPMDIYPLYLIKAILAGDIDKMENLGIYEVIEEDLALCEFVDPSKNEIQTIVRKGIDLMIKELN